MLTTKAAALLLIADHVTAFIANAPALAASGLAEQAGMASLRRPGARFSRRGELALSSRDAAPSWRYEVDDLIKAASPWGSLVEAEIIATDLLKVWACCCLRFRRLQFVQRAFPRRLLERLVLVHSPRTTCW